MPRFEVDGRSLQFTVLNARATRRTLQNAAKVAVAIAGNQLKNAIIQNVSIPPIGGSPASHRAALRQLGSPYSAVRYNTPQIRPSGGFPGFGKPELLVHTVSGRLRSAISGVFDPNTPSYEVRTDLSRAPHLKYVVRGTRVMLPRDILWETAQDPAVQRMMRRTIVRVFGQTFRTQAGLRFG